MRNKKRSQHRTTRWNRYSIALGQVGLVLLTGCTVGPKYKTPTAALAPSFSEAAPSTKDWKAGQPRDTDHKGEWWRVFEDQPLNDLEAQIAGANQDLKTAEAHFNIARGVVRGARASYLPSADAGVSAGTVRTSANAPYFLTDLANNGSPNFSLPIDLNYELDLWGRVRHEVADARAQAQASAADLENVRLSLHAELALDYFALRGADAQAQLFDRTIKAYEDALQLTKDRFQGGLAISSDVAQAETQLEQAHVQRIDVDVKRRQLEHALAVLVGQPPEAVHIPVQPLSVNPPAIPVLQAGVPSELLERRPDIAAAERRVASANEQIGIAKAAYFPTLSLSALMGIQSTSASNWFSWPSRMWAVGPSVSQSVFDGGRRRAASEQARANYDATISTYRQTTLQAFQQVEDNLAAQKLLGEEATRQHRATMASLEALDTFQSRYQGGLGLYLEVVTSQTTALINQRTEIELTTRRLDASVLLIKALGGSWDKNQLPRKP
ncbi:MAG: efflux transporter outer membrane subunit [Acidobacteriaceae bacterium]|nr:efflux transporter outer membrane subunit [Acidobacteriaceae bacterium]